MTRRSFALMLTVAISLSTSGLEAGVIRGFVRVPPASGTAAYTPNPYPGRVSALPGRHDPVRGLATDAVVYLARLDPAADSSLTADPSGHVLAQKNQAFSTRVLPCVVGTTVDFPNQDPIYHNVFSVSPIRRFDLGKYPKGHSKQVRFLKPGLVPVFCDIHPSMACFILILPNHAFTQPGADGAFALPDLPAGDYLLKVWHPDFGEVSRPVHVPLSGDVAVEVSL